MKKGGKRGTDRVLFSSPSCPLSLVGVPHKTLRENLGKNDLLHEVMVVYILRIHVYVMNLFPCSRLLTFMLLWDLTTNKVNRKLSAAYKSQCIEECADLIL
jgi:hypothetical protein